jgi:putative lipase involved disintegration of autophagic bodies
MTNSALIPTYDTYFTGHSLGGAAAVLTALYFYVQDKAPYKIKEDKIKGV